MGVIARYHEFLPVGPNTPGVDLQEGSTRLVPSRSIGRALGLSNLYFKYEGLNPTGSFKDRGMVVAVAKALEAGSRVLMCASTGNTSASMAAYAARTGVRAIVVVPAGEIALNKLSQALMYGAKVIALKGNFDHALQTVRDLSSRYPVALMNSINPHRIEGQKTAASRWSRHSATLPTIYSCRWETRATSPPTGRASASARRMDWRSTSRAWPARRPTAQRPSSTVIPSTSRRRSPRRFASATRLRGRARPPRGTTRAA